MRIAWVCLFSWEIGRPSAVYHSSTPSVRDAHPVPLLTKSTGHAFRWRRLGGYSWTSRAAPRRAEKKEPPESSSRGPLRCLLSALLALIRKIFRPYFPELLRSDT